MSEIENTPEENRRQHEQLVEKADVSIEDSATLGGSSPPEPGRSIVAPSIPPLESSFSVHKSGEPQPGSAGTVTPSDSPETRFLKFILFGPAGIRVGWSVAMFLALTLFFAIILGSVASVTAQKLLHITLGTNELSAPISFLQEMVQFLSLLGAASICALAEKRRVIDYNLSGPHRMRFFLAGTLVGFVALSALVGLLALGGWIHFDHAVNGGLLILELGLLWAGGFLLTGFSEEGMTRCYMLFTLARGINFWWALGTVSSLSLFTFLNPHSNGALGVYLVSALGVLPCFWLELKHSESAGFWQATWVTTAFFGYFHTFNKGESWLGIFSAAAIGFVFCVSVWVTGSAWWAIGYHAAWDWAQTFFYGTPDSGFPAKGHLLTTTPTGSPLWSGGPDGPEGSLLVLVIILVTLIYLVAVHSRKRVQTLKSAPEAALPRLS